MHDGIMLEELGTRTIVLCTEPFEVTAKNIARTLGLPDYPFVLLEHPLGSNTDAQVHARAEVAFAQGVDILTQ